MKKTEVVIVGAGIAGLTAAIYLKRANCDFVIIEGGFPGGLLNKLKTIENYPSYPSITGSELTIKLMEQIKTHHVDTKEIEWYINLRRYGGCYHSGFGMGFERLIMYLTGIENIRDVTLFPRTPGNCDF